jgi:heme-degrading monooxygenase HmoA
MHARMARYTFSGDARELVQRAEAGMLPVFESQPGFRAYSLVETDGEIFSFSAWDSAEQAEAASAAAREWIAENMAGEIELIEARTGEIMLSTALGIRAGATV